MADTDFAGRLVSVIGAARSGLAAAGLLKRHGAEVVLSDARTASQLGDAAAAAEALGVRCAFGAGPAESIPAGASLVVTSPGVPRTAPPLAAARARAIPIWSEIELAYRFARAPIIATTGTNGKTTTTLLIAAMLDAAGLLPVVCGNISADEMKRTLIEAVEQTDESALLVAEISSFQLEWVERFAPRVAILTNITPDHLNRHADFEEYAAAKARIFAAQTAEQWAVIGFDNPASRAIGERPLAAQRIWFSATVAPSGDEPFAWVQDGMLVARARRGERTVPILPASEVPASLPGEHSISNILAAAAAALVCGAPAQAVGEAVRGFRGVPHRMEWVADINGVRFVNNSMCTNIEAAVCSLRAMDRPTVVIAGGADKDLDFTPLADVMRAKARRVVLIGAVTEKMDRQLRAGGYDAIERAATLEDAVDRAAQLAAPGEAVLLSPACASFDMFRDFEARGAAFRAAVGRIAGFHQTGREET